MPWFKGNSWKLQLISTGHSTKIKQKSKFPCPFCLAVLYYVSFRNSTDTHCLLVMFSFISLRRNINYLYLSFLIWETRHTYLNYPLILYTCIYASTSVFSAEHVRHNHAYSIVLNIKAIDIKLNNIILA